MDFDSDGVSTVFTVRGYDPVTVAASIQLGLPFNMIQSAMNNSFRSRRRLSLIEALNNSIQDDLCLPFQQSCSDLNSNSFRSRRRLSLIEALNNSIQDDLCLPFQQSCSDLNSMSSSMMNARTQDETERIYSIRQILNQNHDLLDRGRHSMRVPRIYVKNTKDESYIQEVPRLIRSRTANKRSKSQPNNNNSNSSQDSDYEYDSPSSHISRVDCNEDEWQRGCRCSLQSTSSSIASRSASTSSGDSGIVIAEASWDHVALLPDELPFASGDVITVLDSSSQSGLWFGSCRDSQGWFPASHVKVLTPTANSICSSGAPTTITVNSSEWEQSMRIRRGKIVEELMHTERDYVRLLEDIVQGFMEQTRRRTELFSPSRTRNIFGNLQQIYMIHMKLLRDLELSLDPNYPENTNIGAAFLRNKHSFGIYSDYCNNRPVSCAELSQLSRQTIYKQFFEACRLLRGLPNLSLEGFLLTPVQRICRYPLQLTELLKLLATPTWHDDYAPLEAAERAMRGVAAQINERKRRIEGLQDIIRWQKKVYGLRGPDILESSSILLRSGEVYCRVMVNGQHLWAKEVLLFLFDQSIVICKKDLVKKSFFIFKERMSLSTMALIDLQDGKEPVFGCTVKNAFKLVGNNRQYLFTCADKKSKANWKTAFEQRSSHSPASSEEKRLAFATLNSIHGI